MLHFNRIPKLAVVITALAAMAGSAMAQITVVNSGSLVSPVADDPKTAVLSFNAGATANKLIVQVSAEGQNVDSITYRGVALTPVTTGTGRNRGIYYLDNPFTGGAAKLTVTLEEGVSNGIAIGVISVSGAVPGDATAARANAANSVTLTVPVSGSLVVGGYASNGNSTITPPAGHTAIYNSTNIGSANAAASYATGQTVGSRTYTFGDTSSSSPATCAAIFVPASAAPVITGTSPANGATSVSPDADLVATFSETVVAGSGNIQLWQPGGSSPIESFNAATSPKITIAGSTLTIDPSAILAPNTIYYVLINSGAVVDTSGGNPFTGITNSSTWSFSTGNTPPLVPAFSPKDNAYYVAVNANLVATFSETIQKGTGNITIHRADGTVFETINVTSAAVTLSGGRATINPVNNFIAGAGYYVRIDSTAFRNNANQFYAGISDPTVWNFTALPDLATVDGRLAWMMQQNITAPWPNTASSAGLASYALAAFHLGADLVTANDFINQFHSQFPVPDSDTIDFDSYFWLHLIWRIYHDPVMNARLTSQARSNIQDMMWSFIRTRSRTIDAQGNTWVYHDSENHDAMQKGSYLLCAEALKDAPGYGASMVLADGQTLAQHATAWSGYFQRYFTGRAGEGINAEIASPIYAKYSVGVYYNLMDFAESPALRTLAQRFVTLYWADTASDWTRSGVRGGGEARCYKDNYVRLGSQYSFHQVLYGYGWHANAGTARTFGLIPAASSYRVPAIITACATDPARPNYLYTSRRFGRAGSVVGSNNFIAFDSGNSFLRRDTWVTPDYTMGTLTFDMNRDYTQISDQNRAMGVMFASGPNNRVLVFGEGSSINDKSYADLTGVTRADCMIVQRDQNVNNSGSGTLVFVPQNLWNARVESSGWLFLQSGNAYCAIRPAGGTYSATTASQGVDISMSNIWAPVIIQAGQAANYASFAAFQASVIANPRTFSSNTLNYTSEAGDTFTFYANSKTTPRVNGTTVSLNPAKTYDSPYLSMTHGTDLATVSYPGYQNLLLNFDPASTSFIGVNASIGRYQSTSQTTNTITNFTVPSGSNRKLVLFASWESGNRGISATWNGTQNFTAAANSTSDRNAAILYLDAPTAGTGNIVVTFPASTSSRVGVLSLVGVAPGVARTATSSGRSGSLNLPVDGSFVAGVYTSNGWPTIHGPFSTTLYNGDSGSCEGNAGYQVMLTAGTANYTWSVTNPSEDSHALAAFVPASAAPVMLSTSPADNATAVPIAANLVANFSEPVLKGTGTITIKRTSNNSTVESFNVATSPALTFSGQTLTINPTANLDFQTEFYVVIDATAVIDRSGGNAFAGISSTAAWSFTTVVNPAPTLGSLTPTDNANNVAPEQNLVATFSETVVAGTGSIELRQAGGSLVESFNVASSPRLTFSGATLTINPTNDLLRGVGYYIVIPATAIVDTTGGDAFAGFSAPPALSNWSFTIIPPPATITLLNTANYTTPFNYTSESAPRTYTLAFDPDDTADALVVILTTECGSPSASVTWGGVPMTQVFPLSTNNPVGVYYLNNPANLGLANVDVTISSSSSSASISGMGFSVMALSNAGHLPIRPTAYQVQTGAAADDNIPLVVPTDESFVVAGFSSNDNVNGSFITTSANLTTLLKGDFGSVQGCFAFDADVAAGTNNYQFTFSGTPAFATAVAFAVEIPFADWISNPAYGLAPADRDFSDDPDGDGIPNGVENFFGTNPGTFTQGLAVGIKSGNTFTFNHPLGTLASNLSARYRWSTDLTTFHPGGASIGGITVNFTTEANTPSPGFTRVTATATGTLPDRLFVDVEVTEP
jgi:methionine-rich copper-binding protein CopC